MKNLIIVMMLSLFALTSCKSKKSIPYITKKEISKDSTFVREKTSVILPRKSTMVFQDVFLGLSNEINIPIQIIENENTRFKVQKVGNNLVVELASDSIISTDTSSDKVKIEIKEIEIPVEVEVPVSNKFNWYMLLYSITSTILLFRKQIWWVVKKFIFPLFI